MTVIDHCLVEEVPARSLDRRTKARSKARDIGRGCEWLRLVVLQHEEIEDSFDRLRDVAHLASAQDEERVLAALLTAHAIAKEAVLYPAMANAQQRAHAVAACIGQSRIKIQLAALERLDSTASDYREALARLAETFSEQVFDEECSWFPALARTGDAALQARLSARFVAEYQRYLGFDIA